MFFCVTVAPNFYFYIFILYSILFIYFPSKVWLTIHADTEVNLIVAAASLLSQYPLFYFSCSIISQAPSSIP